MTLEDTDIKFECSQCGQRLAIEKSGAGLSANCPICEHPVTVPKDAYRKLGDFSESSRLHEAAFPVSSEHSFNGNGRPSYADPDEDEMREELVNSAMENGLLENDLSAARTKIARLQQHLRKALDDCERLTKSAAQTQGEMKSLQAEAKNLQAESKGFQAERQQMKADLALSRQKMAVWETQVAEARAKVSEMASAVATAGSENAALLQELDRKTAELRDYRAEGEARLAKRDEALVAANTKAGEVIYALAAAEDEIAALRHAHDETLEELEAARAKIAELSPLPDLLAATETALSEEKDRVKCAEARGASLEDSLNGVRTEVDGLRRTLADNTTGRELLEMRARFDALNEEHNRAVTSLSERDSSLNALTVSAEKLGAELKTARAHQEEAERRAEAALEDKALKDNDVLRGIIERQNSVLAGNSRELRVLRRGRYALRTAYALFGAALLVLVIFALVILKPHLTGG